MTVALPRYTWDQAHILGLATATGFRAMGIKPGTIRQWVHRGRLTPIGKAPGGAHLFAISAVSSLAGLGSSRIGSGT